jgi:hypothetical protein
MCLCLAGRLGGDEVAETMDRAGLDRYLATSAEAQKAA